MSVDLVSRLRTRLKCPSTAVWESTEKSTYNVKSTRKPSSILGVDLQTEFHIGSQL